MKTQPAAAASNAVIYARYSSHSQTEQSIEGQLRDAYAFAQKRGLIVIGEYIDRAFSGTNDSRPDFQRMIRDAERRQFAVVIVWKLDRFTRNRYDSAFYKARLKKYGVRVLSVMEAVSDGPEGIIMEGLLESLAEFYSANLAENIRRGQRESVAKGWFLGGTIQYGYRSTPDHKLVENPDTAPVVREIFRRYTSGEGTAAIAADLNRRGIRSLQGRAWTVNSFSKMLTNPVYVGRATYAGEILEGCSVPLIDEQTFQAAGARREKNRRAPAAGRGRDRFLLSGMAFCGHCGAPLVADSGTSKGGTRYDYYSCAQKKKAHTCAKKSERKGYLEWYVTEQTVQYVLDPARARHIAQLVIDQYKKEFQNGQVKELEASLRKCQKEIDRIVDTIAGEDLPDPVKKNLLDKLNTATVRNADIEIDLAKARLTEKIPMTEQHILSWLSAFRAGDQTDPAFQESVISTFVNTVIVYDDRIAIFYNVTGAKQISAIDEIPALDELQISDGADPSCSRLPRGGGASHVNHEHPGPFYIFVHGLFGLLCPRISSPRR